ncbi:hypothetical protein SacN8_09250 [Sulfolobus acidocaldarius N8]|uniref:Uncharacterized protein n=2 Tax=Sulfolobus acidocaldarius TaxID=2285 RepID=M1J4B9_9CREN|nr:hypothetical protein SacN8_09250 [Sulfolobus acidocaldarius N8]AGE74081.1 hypothetical protein SacRon12I_09270 [Sulfolobus acidocaldarius Ron12/I]
MVVDDEGLELLEVFIEVELLELLIEVKLMEELTYSATSLPPSSIYTVSGDGR